MKSITSSSLQLTLALILMAVSTFAQSSPILILESPTGQQITLSREELESLPQTTFTTSTPWTKGTHTYQGPKLSLITDKLKPLSNGIRIYGINGYSYDINIHDLQKYPFILTLRQDKKVMSLRNKGPFWLLVPFDQTPQWLSHDELHNQLVWQINKIKAL
ncbi:hypothetical protein GCM10007931_19990 [Vibrio algivorus]|uniref:Molybdopterin-binding oxidoreductase n=2 Tax=Vibrio algivorus TaxID=1667024 RepID=A0ABQ6EPT1_9VIBR|nr:hypothetical protein GCM10007931_19990 [Vibrio algivorus]